MSTPNPASTSQPTSASKKATGQVTTPSHLGGFSSPAPRSIPSPAATRKEHAGKTPVNHPTASSSGSKTLGSTPMVHNLSQTGMTIGSSPGGHNASFGTPSGLAGLGVDLGSATPGHLNMATPMLGGTSMMPTMSDLGFSTNVSKRNEDDERRVKMRKVLKSIGRPKGRISEEGIARLSSRLGFDLSIDEDAPVGNREVAIAGNKVTAILDLKQHRVKKVDAAIAALDMQPASLGTIIPMLPEPSAPASRIMSHNLDVPSGVLLQSSLDQIANTLHSLATVDRISKAGGINCFEAINGLYRSLKRLYEAEKSVAIEALGESSGNTDARSERDVLCRKSGKVSYDDSTKVGLALQYWKDRPGLDSISDQAMDIDLALGSQDTQCGSDDVLRLRIGVEECSASMYPPLRVSDEWLPADAEKLLSRSQIQWQEPEPTYAYVSESANNQTSIMNIHGTQRLPDIRFVATLDPPVIMPYPTILNILSSVGQPTPQVMMPVQYHAMLLDIPIQAVNAGKPIEAKQRVLSFNNGEEIHITHDYALSVLKAEYGYKLEEIPFSHPRQLIELLPTLRQWAHFGTLLRDAFQWNGPSINAANHANGVPEAQMSNGSDSAQHDQMSLDDVLQGPSNGFASEVYIDIGLTTSPSPALAITYSNRAGDDVCNALVQVLPNAEIDVSISDDGSDKHDSETSYAKKAAKALSVAGDLGVWIEWMRQKG